MSGQALAGIKVADFSHVVAGPLATHFLALNGAEVTKIEPPGGDPLRNYTLDPAELGAAPAFRGINAGKRSLVLDLKTAEGRDRAEAIIAGADVVVENFRPGVMARLGLDPEALCARHPHLVWCSISGFGQHGPLSDLRANDQIVQSMAGLMLLSGREGEPAQRVGFPIVDTFTGLLAAFAIQTALLQRERGLLVGEAELLGPGPHLHHVGGGDAGPDQADGGVQVVAAAPVGVHLRRRRAADHKGAVVAGAIAHVAVQDVEEGGIPRSHETVAVHVRVGGAALA